MWNVSRSLSMLKLTERRRICGLVWAWRNLGISAFWDMHPLNVRTAGDTKKHQQSSSIAVSNELHVYLIDSTLSGYCFCTQSRWCSPQPTLGTSRCAYVHPREPLMSKHRKVEHDHHCTQFGPESPVQELPIPIATRSYSYNYGNFTISCDSCDRPFNLLSSCPMDPFLPYHHHTMPGPIQPHHPQ